MAERTHIFDSIDELNDYLFCFLMSFCKNEGILDSNDEEKTEETRRHIDQIVLNIKAYAQEYAALLSEGKVDNPLKQDMDYYKKELGISTLDEIREVTIKANKETLKYFGWNKDDNEDN